MEDSIWVSVASSLENIENGNNLTVKIRTQIKLWIFEFLFFFFYFVRVNNYADLFFHDRYDYASCENVDDCIVLL